MVIFVGENAAAKTVVAENSRPIAITDSFFL
jgi:hypothetical protein